MDKKSIFISFIVFIISCLVLVVGMHPTSIYAKIVGINNFGNNPRELYKVYLAGETLGVIESKKELDDYIDLKQQNLKNIFNVDKVYAPSDLKVIKEITYDKKISSVAEIYNKIERARGASSFTIDGYKIFVEGLEKKTESGNEKKEDLTFYVLDKEVFIGITNFGESSIDYTIRVWVKNADYWPVYLGMLEKIKRTFEKEKIEIPYNQLDVHMK